jgi:SPP1 family phage portal protein
MPRINRADSIPTDPGKVLEWINSHSKARNHMTRLEEEFEGHQMILSLPAADSGRPDNRLMNNYAGYISTVNIGYFMGQPVRYMAENENEEFMAELQDVFNYNDEQDENMELAREASIKGVAFEILYIDEDANVRFDAVQSENVILVRDNTIESRVLFAIRYLEKEGDIIQADVYDSQFRTRYEFHAGKEKMIEDPVPHFFEEVPIVEFPNNEERMGDFERVLSLILAYDKGQSNTANDFDDFTDAYLILRNMSGTEESEILAMKKHRVLLLGAEDGAEWLTKTMQDTAAEHYKSRLSDDIHKFSMTPNLTDEAFAGNLSGVALEFKLWGLEQSAAQKGRKFKRALQRRVELICQYLSLKGRPLYDWRSVSPVFTRNMPMNVPDLVKMVVDLRGILSNRTLLSQLPFVSDPVVEMDRVREENEDWVNLEEEE